MTDTSTDTTVQQQIINTCEAEFNAHDNDCSGFVRAVSRDLGITLTGLANDIVDEIQTAPWTTVPDGVQAKAQADSGFLVIGGLKDDPHGHVVVVVTGPLAAGKYPTAYWGRLGSIGKKNTTINWAWNKLDRDKVIYGYIALPSQQ
jgi:hypothetical protein